MEIVGDASDRGLYAFNYGDGVETLARRMFTFTAKEAKEGSTYREVLLIHEVYCSGDVWKFFNRKIRHLTNNKAVEWIFKSGSRNHRIYKLIVEVFLFCHVHQIHLAVSWRY